MPLTLSPEDVNQAWGHSSDERIATRLRETQRLRRRLEYELENVVHQVKALEVLMTTPKRKFEYPNNFENSVRVNSLHNRREVILPENVPTMRVELAATDDPIDHTTPLNFDSVSSHMSVANGKHRGPRKSVWGTLTTSSPAVVDDSKIEECHPQTTGVTHDLTLLPPQVLIKTPIVRLNEYFNCNPAKSTTPINLIATWTPEGGPRPSHLTPIVPGRDTEEASSGGKRIVFSNKLFKRKGFVDWNRFNLVDAPFDSSAMAFLFEPTHSERSFPSSRMSPTSTGRRMIHHSD